MTQTKQRLTAVARRQVVLETACRVFSRSSYRGATTADIAREAGISEPILYRHFGSKRDLYLACLDEAWRSFREISEEAIAADPETKRWWTFTDPCQEPVDSAAEGEWWAPADEVFHPD